MPNTRPAIVTAVTATGSSAIASAAKTRQNLEIYNQSASDTVAISFGTTAAVVGGAGSISLPPTTNQRSSIRWPLGEGYFVPSDQINIISSGSSTAVTIIE